MVILEDKNHPDSRRGQEVITTMQPKSVLTSMKLPKGLVSLSEQLHQEDNSSLMTTPILFRLYGNKLGFIAEKDTRKLQLFNSKVDMMLFYQQYDGISPRVCFPIADAEKTKYVVHHLNLDQAHIIHPNEGLVERNKHVKWSNCAKTGLTLYGVLTHTLNASNYLGGETDVISKMLVATQDLNHQMHLRDMKPKNKGRNKLIFTLQNRLSGLHDQLMDQLQPSAVLMDETTKMQENIRQQCENSPRTWFDSRIKTWEYMLGTGS